MFHNKATTYEQLEKKKPKEKKFKQNAYEEIRKLVDDNEGNNIVTEVKKKDKKQENIKFKFNLFE